MCGIAVFYRTSNKTLTQSDVNNLLINLQVRGTDATGIAWFDAQGVHTIKARAPATEFIKHDVFLKNIDSIINAKWGMLHVRRATHGSPQNNNNNHPLVNNDGVIVHNGVVHPTVWLPGKGECDSEQIMLHIQKSGFSELSNISGTASFAYCDFNDMGTIYLYAHNNPMVLGMKNGIWVMCSTNHILKSALDIKGSNVKKDTVYAIRKGRINIQYSINYPKIEYKANRDVAKGFCWDTLQTTYQSTLFR